MRNDEISAGDVQQGQQRLRESIEISNRLIGEAQQRVETSRALTGERVSYAQTADEVGEG